MEMKRTPSTLSGGRRTCLNVVERIANWASVTKSVAMGVDRCGGVVDEGVQAEAYNNA